MTVVSPSVVLDLVADGFGICLKCGAADDHVRPGQTCDCGGPMTGVAQAIRIGLVVVERSQREGICGEVSAKVFTTEVPKWVQ